MAYLLLDVYVVFFNNNCFVRRSYYTCCKCITQSGYQKQYHCHEYSNMSLHILTTGIWGFSSLFSVSLGCRITVHRILLHSPVYDSITAYTLFSFAAITIRFGFHLHRAPASEIFFPYAIWLTTCGIVIFECLQCFDAVGWVAGMASDL